MVENNRIVVGTMVILVHHFVILVTVLVIVVNIMVINLQYMARSDEMLSKKGVFGTLGVDLGILVVNFVI